MRAARWYGAGDVRVEDVGLPPMKDDDVLVEVAYCGICGSDLHEYVDGPHAIPTGEPHGVSGAVAPLTLGHEFCGTVRAVGGAVRDVSPGDRVAVEPEYRCGRCFYCRSGAYNRCVHMGFAGLMGDGGMAEQAVVPAYMIHRLPDAVTWEQAAVLEPAAVALHAMRQSSLRTEDDCAVFGLGPIGLLAVMVARQRGAGRVFAVDVVPSRLALAQRLGATDVLDAREVEPVPVIRSYTGGLGVPVAFEAVGAQATFENCLGALRKGGEVLLLGLTGRLEFDAFAAVNNEHRVVTSAGYRDVYPELLELVAGGELDLTQLVTKTVPLEAAVDGGLAALRQDRSEVKILIRPEPAPASAPDLAAANPPEKGRG